MCFARNCNSDTKLIFNRPINLKRPANKSRLIHIMRLCLERKTDNFVENSFDEPTLQSKFKKNCTFATCFVLTRRKMIGNYTRHIMQF